MLVQYSWSVLAAIAFAYYEMDHDLRYYSEYMDNYQNNNEAYYEIISANKILTKKFYYFKHFIIDVKGITNV